MNESKCFAEVVNRGKCSILILSKCQGHENCSMFKTEEQAAIDRQKAYERIAKLPLIRQEYIAGAYYSGKMPWHQTKKQNE